MEQHEAELFERNRLFELKNRLFAYEKSIKDERRKLWEAEKDSEQEYTVWSQLELLSTYISGYVSQITEYGYIRQKSQEAINHLHQLSIFDVDCIVSWYRNSGDEYPKIKQFFELLDYIRLLTLEYIERYRLLEHTEK
ncbi:hypothetical protein H6F74_20785 [Trichocoleus sp. FACHB-90]|uniref:hypothetical protein n=1 Tax=Cyanophyceae TaxID=3028117 RepID=UPI0016838A7B|nr:hypothetical protein [Trichocoleus sp. FACHB-90]MBD1928666.1 hypothetical protein [Trichocoleus sp. FACHB-90]